MKSTESLHREVRRLRWTVMAVFGVWIVTISTGFLQQQRRTRFTEIDVERINVINADGKLAVVISNVARMPGNVIGGRERAGGRRGNGLMFYNADGNEAGGLIFDNSGRRDSLQAFGQLSLDRHDSDQVAALRYLEGPGGWQAGLQVSHFPRGNLLEWHGARDSVLALPAAQQDSAMRLLRRRLMQEGKWEIPRLFAGERGQTAILELRDMRGRARFRVSVDSVGTTKLELIDERGQVVHSLVPPN